ncbi:MAG: PEP-utilizing enzyme [Candidatus Staskawiczbacteria bacterium]|jgi:phosphoenolpyruvate synthase/pyruvate phosphate dikinase
MDKNEILKIVKSNRWNIQGFNGVPLYLMSAATDSGWLVKEVFGQGYTHFFYFFYKNRAYMHYDEADWENICEAYFKKVKSIKELEKLVIGWEKRYQKLVKETSYNPKKLDGLSDSQLVNLMKKLSDRVSEAVGFAHAIEGITFGSEKKLREIFGSRGNITEQEFGIVCSPVHPSFLLGAQQKLWALRQLKGEKQDKAIKKFIKDYGWIENSYLGAKRFSKDDIIKRAEGLKVKPGFNHKEVIAQKEKTLKRFNLSEKERFIISTIELCFHWQDERKKYIFQTISALDPIVKAVGARFKIELSDLKFATPQEISEDNFSDLNFKKQLKKRQQKSVYYSIPGKNYIFTNGDYDFFSNGLHVALQDNGGQLKGMVASPGVVQGVVKVCESVSDIDKVQNGEIIVASMTRPEYLPAMQKAAAFITEEGGITCHAAIIAREMKKPCIIGVRTATKVLKDGDLVEVDANKGIVKIIK